MSALTKRVEQLEQRMGKGESILFLPGEMTQAEVDARVAEHAREKGVHPKRVHLFHIPWLSDAIVQRNS